MTVDIIVSVNQTTVAIGATDLEWEYSLVCLDVDPVQSSPRLVYDFFDPLSLDLGKVMAIDNDDRPQGAGTHTVYRFQCDLIVRGCLSWFDSQIVGKLLGDARRSTHVTGRSRTHGDKMFPPGFRLNDL